MMAELWAEGKTGSPMSKLSEEEQMVRKLVSGGTEERPTMVKLDGVTSMDF